MNKNKDLVIVHLVIDMNGGIGTVLSNLIDYQLELGYIVIVVYEAYYAPFINKYNKNVTFINQKKPNFPGSNMIFGLRINQIKKLLRKKYPTQKIVFHAHNVATIGFLSSLSKINLVCTIHGISRNNIISFRSKLSDLIYKKILNKIINYNGTICSVSQATKTHYSKMLKKGEILLVHNGIKPINYIREKNDEFIIAHLGDISLSKGWDTTTKAVSIASKTHSNVNYVFAGKEIGYNKKQIQETLSDFGIERISRYLGHVPNAYERILPEVNLLILSSISEGLPMVIIEAQSLGIPVIATRVGGIPEIIISGNNGYLVDKDEFEISKYIIKLLDNKKLYNSLSENSKITFSQKFDYKIMGFKYTSIYNSSKFIERQVE